MRAIVKQRVQSFAQSAKVRALSVALALMSATGMLTVATPALAADSEYITGISSLWSDITSELNVSNIVSIIGICIGACLVAVLFWFGIRYVVRKISAAVKKGKFSA